MRNEEAQLLVKMTVSVWRPTLDRSHKIKPDTRNLFTEYSLKKIKL